ncbi:MAG: 2-oxo acid dehydrogenase subunit E2 [Gammaproteobacteria bacterium]|nr:2-oxo acid dehydrogenase subunit E2 [Gammaproteobacteria bacterium]
MTTFNLPDLGEGLPEAEIVTWHVKEGDEISTDQPLLSVETAKAVVDVPSPVSGKVLKLYAGEGDVVETGKPLVDFVVAGESGKTDVSSKNDAGESSAQAASSDSGTVVGNMPSSDETLVETARAGSRRRAKKTGRVKAAPAVRALAKSLGVDLANVEATGRNGLVTANDVRAYASDTPTASTKGSGVTARPQRLKPLTGEPERLRGPRRAMAQSMSASRDQIAQCTLFDDADIHGWAPGQDITVRIIRALVAGCKAEPALNGWYDGEAMTRRLFDRIDLAMAVDTPDGLIVPVLRDVGSKDAATLRSDLDRMKVATRERSVAPADMKNPTITLSNFGMMAGRYASPVIVPPMIAILGTGGTRHDVVPVMGGIEVHKRIPLSLTFDHRCVTGGEACRLLAALIADLQRAN